MTVQSHRKGIDMLNGSILSGIVRFAVPVALSGLLQQLFNAADTAVVGQFAPIGKLAVAAVSGNSFVINLMVSLFIGISVGANVQMAACHGMNDREGMQRTLHTSLLFSLFCGIVLTIVGWFIAPTAHRLLSTGTSVLADGTKTIDPVVLEQAIAYFRIYFLAMPFIMVYNFASAILRAKGDTRRPLIVLAASGVLNVVLNVLFVKWLKMNADGVAIATALSNAFSCAALIWLLLHEDDAYRLHPKALRIHGRTLRQIVRIGLPAGIQNSMFAIANVILQSSINIYGNDVVAGTGIGIYCEYFGMNVVVGFSQAATSFTGQNYAASKMDRCRKVARMSVILGFLSTLIFSSLVILLREPFVSIFVDSSNPANALVAETAMTRIIMVGLFQCFNGIGEIFSGCMRGMKRSLVPALISVGAICGVRLLWILCFHQPEQGYEHLITCFRLSWYASAVCQTLAYLMVIRKEKSLRGIPS